MNKEQEEHHTDEVKLSKEIERFTKTLLEEEIGQIFEAVHEYFETRTGDISPGQMGELDELVGKLTELIKTQVMQNSPSYSVVNSEKNPYSSKDINK